MRTEEQNDRSARFYFSRREFLKGISAAASFCAAPFSGQLWEKKTPQPRKGRANPYIENGKPLLVVVEGTDVEKMLAKGLETIGGLKNVVHSGDSVFIKPNYGSHRAYPTGSDVNFLVSIAGYIKKDGGKVTICDSSDIYVINRYNDFEYVFKTNNVFEIGKKAGVEVICTHPTDEKEYVSVHCGKWEKNPDIKVNRHLLKADVIINQPMLKKHGDASMTCALKNFYGAVYQPQRMHSHDLFKEGGQGRDFFMKTIAEFADAMQPELNIVDARKILTVKGPSLKEGSVVKDINKIIISGDIVATDAYCAQVLEANDNTFKKEMIAATLQYAEKLGLGTADLNKVKIIEIKV